MFFPAIKNSKTIPTVRRRLAGAKTSRNSLFTDENHCSRSHKFLQIHPIEQGQKKKKRIKPGLRARERGLNGIEICL